MNCKKCGATNPEGLKFCTACGAPLVQEVDAEAADQTASVPPVMSTSAQESAPTPVVRKSAGGKRVFPLILGLVSGLVSIWCSFQVKDMPVGSIERDMAYGGDAYTGIQNAAAQAANNVKDVAEIIQTGISGFLLAFGIALVAYFLWRLLDNN